MSDLEATVAIVSTVAKWTAFSVAWVVAIKYVVAPATESLIDVARKHYATDD